MKRLAAVASMLLMCNGAPSGAFAEERNPFESKTPKGDGEPDEEAIAGARPEAQEEEATRAKNSETPTTEESI